MMTSQSREIGGWCEGLSVMKSLLADQEQEDHGLHGFHRFHGSLLGSESSVRRERDEHFVNGTSAEPWRQKPTGAVHKDHSSCG